ncbi:MAG: hypothetical protein SCALA701_02490 [Candidatus Scalindua sp.]|nr:MAG: hypothetical protein SCALA701_02490 [Candidatus Scalindua sp.]
MVSISEVQGPIKNVVLDKYLCSCGELFLRCPFYLELEKRINELGGSFTLKDWHTKFLIYDHKWLNYFFVRPLRNSFLERIRDILVPLWPGYQKKIDNTCRQNVMLARSVLTISNKQIFVDAQKDSMRIKYFQESDKLDLYVIHLVRDVRGGVASIMKNLNINNVVKATKIWYTKNMNSERARRYVPPSRWFRLAYDDLCADTQGTIDRISDFVGCKRVTVPKNFYDSEHHIIGNRMRLTISGDIKRDDSWKKRLNQEDLKIIARIAGEANHFFGYDWP